MEWTPLPNWMACLGTNDIGAYDRLMAKIPKCRSSSLD